MSDFIGKSIAGYQIGAEIGRGSLGTVYQAERQGKRVAVKIIPLTDLGAAAAFAEQMAAVAALQHPRILDLYDYGTETGYAYLVMQLIEGGNTLANLLESGPLSRWKALEMIRQIAAALEAAHAANILHLDLKPANVLLNDKNWPWVADFGLAQMLGRDAGGAAPIAPEQAQARPVDQRTDVYALGLLLYQMLVGALPELSAGLPVSPHTVDPKIPESISDVTLRALAPSPDDRYSTVSAFTAALKAATSDSSYREPVVKTLAALPLAAAAVAAVTDAEPEVVISSAEEVEPEDIEPEADVSPEDIEPVLPEHPVSDEPGVLIRMPKATGSVAKASPQSALAEEPADQEDGAGAEIAAAGVLAAGAVAMATAGTDEPDIAAADAEAEEAAERAEPDVEAEGAPAVEPLPEETARPRPEVIMTTAPPIVKSVPAGPPPLPPPRKSGSGGPSEWKMPVWVTVIGLLLVAVIIVWVIFAMSFSDTGARLSATQTAAAMAVGEPTATETPAPTNTPVPLPTETPTQVATSTPVPEPSPTDTPEVVATDTPEPEPSPTDTPAPEPTATETPAPTATPPTGEWTLLSPAIGDPATTGPSPFNFEWQWSEELEPGQGFEVRVWRAGQGPQGAHDAVADSAAGLIRQVDETTYAFDLDISNAANVQNVSSVYNWTVALVQLEPEYKDLGQQAEPGILQYIGTRGPEDVAPPPAPDAPAETSPEDAAPGDETAPDGSGSGG